MNIIGFSSSGLYFTLYTVVTAIGFMHVLTGGTMLSRVIRLKINVQDIFNKENETFPQHDFTLMLIMRMSQKLSAREIIARSLDTRS
jgi:hypothetical protein